MNELTNDQIWEKESEITKPIESKEETKLLSWDDFDLDANLLRGIFSFGFDSPAKIQLLGIPPMISNRDIIIQSQSGTGKTGMFVIGALQILSKNLSNQTPQILVICNTHEMAHQIAGVFTSIGCFMEKLKVKTLIGGMSVSADITDLKQNSPNVIVGTCGRIYDMIYRKHISMNDLKLCIIDEADEILSRRFQSPIYEIFQYFPSTVQIALVSATYPDEIIELSEKILNNPVKIFIEKENLTLEGIDQNFIAMNSNDEKLQTLKDLFGFLQIGQAIIYCNTTNQVNELYQELVKDGFAVCAIHGSMDKTERETSFANFKKGTYRVLISSSITARGIDIQSVNVVINYDIPRNIELYLHAIGRSGRHGKKGLSINFVTKHDVSQLRRIEDHYKISIKEFNRELVCGKSK